MSIKSEFDKRNILNKLITKKQLHKYLKNYGYDKEQIKYFTKLLLINNS